MAADAFLFTDRVGGPIRQSNWYFRVYRPVLRATLPQQYHHVTFHDLRHTCAAYLIEHGFHPKVIQQQMRHSTDHDDDGRLRAPVPRRSGRGR